MPSKNVISRTKKNPKTLNFFGLTFISLLHQELIESFVGTLIG